MKRGDLVLIRWEDSAGCPIGWQQIEDARGARVAEVESVGWVMATSRRGVQLVPHVVVAGAGGVQGYITIPRSAILAVSRLAPVTSSCSAPWSAPKRRRSSAPGALLVAHGAGDHVGAHQERQRRAKGVRVFDAGHHQSDAGRGDQGGPMQ